MYCVLGEMGRCFDFLGGGAGCHEINLVTFASFYPIVGMNFGLWNLVLVVVWF